MKWSNYQCKVSDLSFKSDYSVIIYREIYDLVNLLTLESKVKFTLKLGLDGILLKKTRES